MARYFEATLFQNASKMDTLLAVPTTHTSGDLVVPSCSLPSVRPKECNVDKIRSILCITRAKVYATLSNVCKVPEKGCSTAVSPPHMCITTPGGATTTGPDATPPPAICQNLRGGGGGGSAGGLGGGYWQLGQGGGGLRATHYYHMHSSRGCLGAWGYRGMYAIIAISCLCQEESLKGLKD